MGMPKGSRWKRVAVFDDVNADKAAPVFRAIQAYGLDTEWWVRRIRSSAKDPLAMRPVYKTEDWLMVRRGDWPIAYVLAKSAGADLADLDGAAARKKGKGKGK